MENFFDRFGLPAYPGGNPRGDCFCAGSGLADDRLGERDELSYLCVIEETAAAAFESYCARLEAAGFVCGWRREAPFGQFAEYVRTGTLLYVYYIPAERCARLIVDRAGLPLSAFVGEGAAPAVFDDTCLMQYGLCYGRMVKGVSCDCGMMYVIRLHSGALIVVDGGEAEQATDAAVADFTARVRELTGPGPIRVALWFCTHAHDDHMDFFLKFLRLHRAEVALERVAFNFPWSGSIRMAPYVSRMRARLRELYPGVRFLKPHTGQRFSVENAVFDVLTTHEDLLGFGGERVYPGMNATGTVARVDFDGASVLFMADMQEENGEVLARRLPPETLRVTFTQAAHHCINRVENMYSRIRTDRVLIPEGRALINPAPDAPYAVIRKYNDEKNIVFAGDATAVFTVRDGGFTMETYPAPQGEYDHSGV